MQELDIGGTFLSGDAVLSRAMTRWLKPSDHASADGIEMVPDQRPWTVDGRRTLARTCAAPVARSLN